MPDESRTRKLEIQIDVYGVNQMDFVRSLLRHTTIAPMNAPMNDHNRKREVLHEFHAVSLA